MEDRIVIITTYRNYVNHIAYQMLQIFGDRAHIVATTSEDLDGGHLKREDIIVLSSDILYGIVQPYLHENQNVIIAKREVNVAAAEQLLFLPPKQKILVVNDTKQNAEDAVASLKNIFFEHEYVAFGDDPFMEGTYNYILTPGERHLLPKTGTPGIDIGSRILSIDSIREINESLKNRVDLSILHHRNLKSQLFIAKENSPVQYEQLALNATYEGMTIQRFEEIKHEMEALGYLDELVAILYVYVQGKERLQSLGRRRVLQMLHEQNYTFSEQQLRRKLEGLQQLELLLAGPGRSGTKITSLGEQFLQMYREQKEKE